MVVACDGQLGLLERVVELMTVVFLLVFKVDGNY